MSPPRWGPSGPRVAPPSPFGSRASRIGPTGVSGGVVGGTGLGRAGRPLGAGRRGTPKAAPHAQAERAAPRGRAPPPGANAQGRAQIPPPHGAAPRPGRVDRQPPRALLARGRPLLWGQLPARGSRPEERRGPRAAARRATEPPRGTRPCRARPRSPAAREECALPRRGRAPLPFVSGGGERGTGDVMRKCRRRAAVPAAGAPGRAGRKRIAAPGRRGSARPFGALPRAEPRPFGPSGTATRSRLRPRTAALGRRAGSGGAGPARADARRGRSRAVGRPESGWEPRGARPFDQSPLCRRDRAARSARPAR